MIRRAALVAAAYAVVTLVMTWPYVSYADFGSATYGGDEKLIIWTLAWDNHALLSGLPLFQSNLFFPAANSLRYNEHLFGVSLFTLPWAAAGVSPVLAYRITWWLTWILNGAATFGLLRRHVGSAIAAFLGSLAFVCSFYVMLHAHAHLHLIWLWPMPLSMLLLERWFDEPSWRGVSAWTAVFAVGALTSWYVAVMMLMVNVVAGAALVLSETPGLPASSRRWPRRLLHFGASAAVLAVVIGPFATQYLGMAGAPGEAAANSATFASYLVPAANTLAGQWWLESIDARPGPIWGEQTLFAGWLALLLGVLGLAVLVKRGAAAGRSWMFPALAAVGLFVSLGPSPGLPGGALFAPFAWLSALPGFEGMRAPARFGSVAMLGVAGLAAVGASTVARALPRRWQPALLLLVPLMLAEWYVVGFPAGKPVPHPVPTIYETDEIRSARSLVSLPEYSGTTDWVRGGDYLYYSMAHWRPIVNGFGRTEPAGHADVVARVRDFPSHAAALRSMGLQYVVVHADRYDDRGRSILAAAEASARCRLVRQIGSDYLFELVEGSDGSR